MRMYINIHVGFLECLLEPRAITSREVSLRDSPSSDPSSRSAPMSNRTTMTSSLSVFNLSDGDFCVVSQTYLYDAYRTTPTPVIGC